MASQLAPWEVYKQALIPLKFGDALWEPGPTQRYKRVRPGDVGYTRRGRFHLLFSAGGPLGSRELGVDVPTTFEPLDVDIALYGDRPPGYLHTDTIREIGVDVGGSAAVTWISFELTRNQGAALITKHPTYQEDVDKELTFEDYIKKHYQSWVDFSRERGYGREIRPVLVTGVDLTQEFATVAYSNNRTRMECNFSAAIPAVASASASVWGSWRTEGLSESSGLESVIPEEYNQCVFIRYYTIRRRMFIPMVIKAGAGPHQLPKPDPSGDNAGEEGVRPSSDDDSMEVDGDQMDVDYPETGSHFNAFDEVIHNVASGDRDGFDIVAEYIFQRSEVNSVLLHHRDIQDLLQEGEEETIKVLTRSGVASRVEIDKTGVGQLMSPGATKFSRPILSRPGGGDDDEVDVMRTGRREPLHDGTIDRSLFVVGNQGHLPKYDPSPIWMDYPAGQPSPLASSSGETKSSRPILSHPGLQRSSSLVWEDHPGEGNKDVTDAMFTHSCICGCGGGACIPQREYERQRPDPLGPQELQVILFSVNGKCGYPLKDALVKRYTGLDGRDDKMFVGCTSSISIKLKWLPYEDWTKQIRTLSRKDGGDNISRAKLATEVAKRMETFFEQMEDEDVNLSYWKYRIQPGIIDLEHLELVALKRVTKSSWMPHFRLIPPSPLQ